jgi:hypothetical protein
VQAQPGAAEQAEDDGVTRGARVAVAQRRGHLAGSPAAGRRGG